MKKPTFQNMRERLEDEDDSLFLEGLTRFPDAVSWRDEKGLTLSHFAARNGRAKPLGELLRAGADPSARDMRRRSLLHEAVIGYAASLPSLHVLLGSGVDADARDAHWHTPLMVACNYSNLYAVSALVAWGVKDRFRDRRGRNAYDVAEWALAGANRDPEKYAEQIEDCALILAILSIVESS